jgi:hypothetical protein
MKLTKQKLKEMIREELLKEATPSGQYGGYKILDLFDKWLDLSEKITKAISTYDKKDAVKFKKAIDNIERNVFPKGFVDF